ncbi:hypothetical protein SDC9_191510 [bioreactor metagenome]|uniref:Uncharacterized protein n=1 Tax=bioreactor metagenome TaxID=1076179 RepID=A0A645I0I0_9ZZZZ
MKQENILSMPSVQNISLRKTEDASRFFEISFFNRRWIMNRKKTAVGVLILLSLCTAFYLYGKEFRKSSGLRCSVEPDYHYESLYTVRKANDFCYFLN